MDRIDTQALARGHLTRFVRCIEELLVSQQLHFDLLVGGGNTGVVFVYLTQCIYHHIGLWCPPTLLLPIYRYDPRALEPRPFNNDVLCGEVKRQLVDVSRLTRVLFVDDEIAAGTTALAALRLLAQRQRSHHVLSHLQYYIVAEDQGFEPPSNFSETTIHFRPYAGEVDGYNNLFAYIIPPEFVAPIQKVFPEDLLFFHHRMNLLLNLPLKDFNQGHPKFSYSADEALAQHVPQLREMQKDFQTYITQLIAEALA